MAKTGTRYEAVKQGGPFERVEYTVPTPGPNEVLIHTRAVALNPADWKMLDYGLFVSSWPVVLGFDGAGIIEEVGSDVKDFKKGDEVFGHYDPDKSKRAAFQDYAVLDQTQIGLKPKDMSFEDAASVPVGFVTAAAAIHLGLDITLPFLPDSTIEGGPNSPSTILVLGGSSSVGASAIQILRLALPDSIIIATSSTKNHTQVSSVGANHVIDYKSSNVLEQINQVTSNNGVDAILDVVNSVVLEPSFLSLLEKSSAQKKKLFSEVLTGHNLPSESVPKGIEQRPITYTPLFKKPGGQLLFKKLSDLLQKGKYKVPVPITKVGKGFDAIGQGILTLRGGVSGTKLVISLE
ncbi:MAG: hypothetical protein M1823_004378 [Watsoniomyces obsoletus]|nr:MAG: hypothetical protein M1823_004378 [Watsoniomyces obsoletus]